MVANEYDLVLKSSVILTPEGRVNGQIAVKDERIVAILGADEPVAATKVIDAGDKPVIPGLIDTHAHFRDPGYTHKEDYYHGTIAAAAGGVTTVFDMPNVDPPTTTADRLKAHLENAQSKAVVDFGHNASGVVPENIKALADAGATAFKVWMMKDIGRDYPHPPGTSLTNDAVLYRVFEEVAETGLPLYIHPHNHDLYELFVQRSQQQWGMDFRSYARALRGGRGVVLNTAIATILEMQRSVGTKLHVLHLSTEAGIKMVAEAKAEGRDVTAEANPFAMFVTNDWDKIERHGPFTLGFWVPEEDNPYMWKAVQDGTIDVVGSDHGPHTREEKEVGWTDMYTAPGGSPMIEQYLRLLLTEVNSGRLTLERVVELCCYSPAKLTGYYGRKGAIVPGADADLVVLDMDHEEVLHAEHSHYMCGWMSAEDLPSKGRPQMTVLRGRVIMEDGNVTAEKGSGRLLRPQR
ncbi:amidohydrolase family protein [Nocardioides sp. LMS-CY]|uniref:Dihydroorotase n=1 Tax=Nocardioides soli TaxID=1036020 RepID=A0A7W4VVM2_9ACTN|nr:amidohydrolase family protein [Nocardioides sp. LMS-CY]MBB3042609.1 dihydroorotase [Nocardioides soli]QWF22733.1 amidohydrolase family protein [Nocardioides sp. LMS-CY]